MGIASRRSAPRILIIEDTAVIAMLIDEIVRVAGCEVTGIAYSMETARAALARHDFDAVLLDLGLGSERTYELADVLLERGIPFAFVTAYQDILEPRHKTAPVLHKPFSTELLLTTVRQLVASAGTPGGSEARSSINKAGFLTRPFSGHASGG